MRYACLSIYMYTMRATAPTNVNVLDTVTLKVRQISFT